MLKNSIVFSLFFELVVLEGKLGTNLNLKEAFIPEDPFDIKRGFVHWKESVAQLNGDRSGIGIPPNFFLRAFY